MTSLLEAFRSLLTRILPSVPRHAIVGAWFFAIASMVPLLWLMWEGHGDGGSSHVFGATVGDITHTVWGLTYPGTFGTILLGIELLAGATAIAFTLLPARFAPIGHDLGTRLRRIGHGYLTGWAGLWMIGTMYLASVSPGFFTVQATFIAALFACTVYRAVREWTPADRLQLSPSSPGEPIEIDVAAAEDDADATDSIASHRLELI